MFQGVFFVQLPSLSLSVVFFFAARTLSYLCRRISRQSPADASADSHQRAVMVYFVYVRYEFDKVKKVTTSNHVKDFMPESCSDFEVGRLYSVYWEGDSRTAGAYYDAEILHMTACKEEMDDYLKEARSRHTNKGASAAPIDHGGDKVQKPKKKKIDRWPSKWFVEKYFKR